MKYGMSTSDGPESTENENGLSLSSRHTRESFSGSLHISIVQLQIEKFILCLFKCSLFILLEVYKMLPVERMLPHRNIPRTIIPAVYSQFTLGKFP